MSSKPTPENQNRRFLKNGQIATIWNFSKLGATVGLSQAMVKGIGFIAGILIIRLLPTNEYAYYTVANTMLGTMAILADGGISSGVMAQGGKNWQDRGRLGSIVSAGLKLRNQFAIFSLITAVPILILLLRSHNASWLAATIITLSLVPAFISSLSAKIFEIPPKLHQSVFAIQKIQVGASTGRLLLNGIFLFIFPFTAVALLCAGVSQVFANWKLRKISNEHADHKADADPKDRTEIIKVVRRILPNSIYFSISGQFTIWLIALFGSTEMVAQVGALTRLSLVLGILTSVFATIVVPRFSRLDNERNKILKVFNVSLGIVVITASMIVAFVSFFPDETLWILGGSYSELHKEVITLCISSSLNLILSVVFLLSSSRGWIMKPLIYIPYSIVIQVAALLVFDISTTMGVILVSLSLNLGQLLIICAYSYRRIIHI